jgi:hypothetical protein
VTLSRNEHRVKRTDEVEGIQPGNSITAALPWFPSKRQALKKPALPEATGATQFVSVQRWSDWTPVNWVPSPESNAQSENVANVFSHEL